MYHSLATEDILDLINICQINLSKLSLIQIEQVEAWKRLIPKMLKWLEVMSHPDRRISFFNDAAFKVAPDNDEIFLYHPNKKKLLKEFKKKLKTIVAAGGIVKNDENQILFIFRKGKWDLPKGKIEKKIFMRPK